MVEFAIQEMSRWRLQQVHPRGRDQGTQFFFGMLTMDDGGERPHQTLLPTQQGEGQHGSGREDGDDEQGT